MRSALADGTKDAIVTNEIVNRDDDNEVKFTPKIGQLMMFEYNARVSKQVLHSMIELLWFLCCK